MVRYLAWGHHVDFEKFRVEGYGASQPVASNQDSEIRAQNRRIEIWME